ncbi:allophanate hydrolase [Thiomicrorhabdus sp. ZW0627]|uniref:allophanate hydrolase n=1 Tax=Thiomicrorhabdus sp. ZW0627 TaxID=3039774 RepID=UPI0024367967|nr:allophanate hydrolase [Thiomicrorhabdus sp. ZW0627]MDG6773675.1 allophanate hydrolase [Thiomicrorhabdus sp. ZW0627]
MKLNDKAQNQYALNVGELHKQYAEGKLKPQELFATLHEKAGELSEYNIWIHLLSFDEIQAYLDNLGDFDPQAKPLWGVPFAIKDNIDLANVPTSAACPSYAFTPSEDAEVVRLLIEAGAIPLGKTNLDQFATGLVGTRSPYGVCHNSFDFDYVSGGSSSGSAISVAMGLCSFSLGTDTAGSGRVPAAFNNLLGLKPSKGALSTRGVVPAVKSQDVVSIFALDSVDAEKVFAVAAKQDEKDSFSRDMADLTVPAWGSKPVIGIPDAQSLVFYGDTQAEANFKQSVETLKKLGYEVKEIDFTPWLETAKLLYGGAWVAERYAAIAEFIESDPKDMDPTVEGIIRSACDLSAADAYRGAYQLQDAIRQTESIWNEIDCFVTPTTPTIFKIEEVQKEPVALNSALGTYTNFMNLLDYSAVAMPTGFREDGMPCGITLFAPAGSDNKLLNLTKQWHGEFVDFAAVNRSPIQSADMTVDDKSIPLAVVGAHLTGFPLNGQLIERGAKLLKVTKTAPKYQFFELSSRPILKPGLVKTDGSAGASIELEVWAMPKEHLGSFLALIPSPLGLGKVELEDGSEVVGFICEPNGVVGAREITEHGGWRNWMKVRPQD